MSSGSALAAPPGWFTVDLGTLGGPTSYANGVNDAGKVVGDSVTDDGDSHAFSWTQATGMVDLGTLGGSYASAAALNAAGMVAGTSSTDSGEQHAVRWDASGVIEDLGDLGGHDSFATAINADGQVVGTSTTLTGEQHAFSAAVGEPMLDLGTLGGSYSFATAVNASGRVVGVSATLGDLEEHAFSWTPGTGMVDIGAAGSNSRPTAVNDAGQIVGSTTPSDNPEVQQAFIWNEGTGMTLIGAPSSFSQANAISPSGQVVGVLPSASDVHVQHAFTWTPGTPATLTDIGTLGGDYGAAYAVNTTGAVVGNSTIADDAALHAFYWTTAGLLDLGTLGGSDSFGVAVNGSGQVVAFSGNADGDTHAIVWQKDTTPPVITRTVTGTLGSNGWYTSNVAVTWSATDAETAVTTTGCGPASVSANTTGTTLTCQATSGGGTATQSVTIKRDATPPTVAYAAHAASYAANQAIVFGCTATDATSGVATTCQGVNIAANTLAPGTYARTTSATDNAGNTRTVSTTFAVTAVPPPTTTTPTAICLLMQSYVQGSAKYRALTSSQRFIVDIVTTLACSWVKSITPYLSPTQKASLKVSFKNTVNSLAADGWITSTQATTLRGLVDSL